MKRRVLFKKSASLVLALTLTTQGLPAYALVNEIEDTPVAETESCVDTVAEDVEVITEDTQEEIETDIVLAETTEEENAETAEKDNAETADETEDVEEAEQEEVVEQYQAENPGNDATAEPIQPVYDQAKVQNVTYGDVATNPEYKQFSFQFGDDKGHQYECFITGLKGIRGGMEDIQSAAQRIANYFLTYVPLESFKLVLDEFDCIDAEKNDNGWDDRRPTLSGSPYGDSQLCWAAVDSNMLTYTGWSGPYKNEDQVFTAYTDSFFNMPGFEDAGLEWFLNGIFPNQQVTEEGEPMFQDHLEDIYNGSTQLRKPETGGYANDYYYGNVSQLVKAGDDDFNAALVIDNLKAGNAIGTSVNFMDEDQMPMSAHALTVFGYIRDLADQGMGGLKSVFVANSDDDMGNTEYIIHEDPKITEEKREAKPNKLSMDFLYPCYLQGKETWCMDNSPWNDRVISDFAILKSKVSVPDTSKEELGTKDPVHSQDMVITGFCEYEEGMTTFEEGEEFRLSIYAKNMSYASFKAEDDPVINFKCSVYLKIAEYPRLR